MEAHERIALTKGAAITRETIAPMPGGSPDFSLVLGGPLFQVWRRARLSGDALELLGRRVVAISTLCWLPLLVLSLYERRALGGVVLPFLYDIDLHIRFLVAIPLMIVAELIVHKRMRSIVQRFRQYELIPPGEETRFDAIIASALRLRNSVFAELLLIAFVYGFGVFFLWRTQIALATPTWYGDPANGGVKLTLTGLWYVYLSVPFFQFLLFRWYFRLFIWTRFLFQTARIRLSLLPMHPDGVGGLGFLSHIVYAFAPLLLAHGCILAGLFLNRILYMGASLMDFKFDILGAVVFLLIALLGPLMFFSPQLAAAKRAASRDYGVLAERYVRNFNAKWLVGRAPPGEELLGSGDIQSLADMGGSFEIVRTMRPVPFTKETILQLVILTLAPVLPLVLTMISFDELIKKLLGILF